MEVNQDQEEKNIQGEMDHEQEEIFDIVDCHQVCMHSTVFIYSLFHLYHRAPHFEMFN